MRRIATISVLLAIAALTSFAAVYAASGGQMTASRVIYEAGDETSTLKFEGKITFDYAGYHFSAESAEITIARPKPDELQADLKQAVFEGGVSVSTPDGGKATASTLTVRKVGSAYQLTGGLSYSEDDLRVKAGKINFDRAANTLTATGGVEATYLSPEGIMGDDGQVHPIDLVCDGIIYNRSSGSLKNTGTSRPTVEYDGFIFSAGNLELRISEDGLIGLSGADDLMIEGRGITVSGLNASYSPGPGEIRIWGSVRSTRNANEFSGEDVTWYIREDNNRIRVTQGSATVDITGEEGHDLFNADE